MKLNKKDKIPEIKRIHLRSTNPKFEVYVYYNSVLNLFRLLYPHYTSLVLELTPVVCIHNMMIFVARNLSRLDKNGIESLVIVYEESEYTLQEFFDTYCRGESIADWASKDVKV